MPLLLANGRKEAIGVAHVMAEACDEPIDDNGGTLLHVAVKVWPVLLLRCLIWLVEESGYQTRRCMDSANMNPRRSCVPIFCSLHST